MIAHFNFRKYWKINHIYYDKYYSWLTVKEKLTIAEWQILKLNLMTNTILDSLIVYFAFKNSHPPMRQL